MKYKELFDTFSANVTTYMAVIFDPDANEFYEASFTMICRGGAHGYQLDQVGQRLSIEDVRTLAKNSDDSRAKRYISISAENYNDLLRA